MSFVITNFKRIIFPDLDHAGSDGLLAVSSNLTVNHLWSAYTGGIFPWPVKENQVLWFSPPQRAVLDFDKLRVSRSIRRDLKKSDFRFKFNENFTAVINNCAALKRRQEGTWITSQVISAYVEFHKLGYAVSGEVFDHEGKLVGGLYGIKIGNFFAGESMFNTVDHAAKYALVNMIEYLQDNFKIKWLDSQVINPFMARFGAFEISRGQYMQRLNECHF